MKLLIEPDEKEAFRSLTDDHPARLQDFTIGDVIALSVALIPRIIQQWDSKLFAPIDLTDWTIRVAVGGFQLPVSGSFPLTYTTTSATRISYDPTAEEIEASLNSIAAITALGGLDVVGENGFFIITWRLVGVRNLILSDASDLVPVSLIEIEEAIAGDVDTREVQTLRIRQDVGAFVTLLVDSTAPAITVAVVAQGSGSVNHKIRLTFPSDRWNGNWTFTALGGTSDFIDHDAGQEEIQAAIAAITAVGSNNVSVTQEDENNFLVMFKNGRGNQDITGISADGTTLKVIGTKSGDLDLRSPRMEFLIPDDSDSILTSLEVEATPDAGLPEKVLRRDVVLNRAVITSGATIPPTIPGTYMLHNLTGFTGGGQANVDGAAHTVGKALGSLFRGVVGGTLYEWELLAGTAASNAPGIIRPTDYNAATNAVNLIQVGG